MDEDYARFTRLYEQFYPRVLAYALRRVTPDHAREVADETFLLAWRRLADLPDAVLPWLLVTARNTIADLRRRGQRQDAIAMEFARCSPSLGEPAADAIAVERITVLGALAQLTEQDRDALMLTVWDGLTNREAAAVTGCSTAAFAVRLHRARRRLATAMEDLDHRYNEGVTTTRSRSTSGHAPSACRPVTSGEEQR